MAKNHAFKLIQGTFTSSAAAQILFGLIGSKIQFHTMENFSSQERLGKDAPLSKKRIQALKKAQVALKKWLDTAEKDNLKLKIEGNITISTID